jgi:putative mRNA 3-end processing factor
MNISLKVSTMLHPKHWIDVRPEGLFCAPGGFYIDPLYPVDIAVITHGHADHARSGHKKVYATPATIAIMRTRYGENCADELIALPYRKKVSINNVELYFLPAGHILGSAQAVITHGGARLIVSGDYKRAPDPTCAGFAVENCDVFITEATFSLPVFKHPPLEVELKKLLDSLAANPKRCHLVGAYALGKCQRIIAGLRQLGYHDKIYLHGALIKLCELYQKSGIDLGALEHASTLDLSTSAGKIVLAPPSALHDRWSRRFEDTLVALASGWMQIRARAKQKGIDLPLIISDHADWNELIQTIQEVNPSEVWVTHGREEALVYQATVLGYKAQALSLLGYEEGLED